MHRSTFHYVTVHLIFSTRDRDPCLVEALRPKLFAYLEGIARKHDVQPRAVGGWFEHIHTLLTYPPRLAIADIARTLKANSSRWLRSQTPLLASFAWQEGYAAFAVSRSQIAGVATYIANQSEHHRTRTFAEEWEVFFDAHTDDPGADAPG